VWLDHLLYRETYPLEAESICTARARQVVNKLRVGHPKVVRDVSVGFQTIWFGFMGY
jgi:hypothetical protein